MCVPCMCVLVRVLICGLISLRSTLRLLAYVVYRQPRTSWLWGGWDRRKGEGAGVLDLHVLHALDV